ncbi:HNH endonuclease [Thalassolituus pacificus]|uniref:HNH endonuclease n=1 Tax=Thalassolituus pacificus TaxID=2975440 RepID=A0A9X3AEY1_9GAMM|nr:HNH endonuclease [Thalassolituus pacificus]MCT7357556.1 HNH endonuclease [Thalassolituus pacificus]
MHTVITENDESIWEDQTGFLYHFPKRYRKYLTPGTEVIYYKGKIKKAEFRDKRLSDDPHYFAKAVIGKVYPDKQSAKGDFFATIEGYASFNIPVLAKQNEEFLEVIPDSQRSNYWRNGVREITRETYNLILSHIKPEQISEQEAIYNDGDYNDTEISLESGSEGTEKKQYVTVYERDPKYRKQAIAIHGTNCAACGFNFGQFYGDYADGFIHIHHINPVSEFDTPKAINPEKDLIPLCANCHSVIHRKKSNTLTIQELVHMINQQVRTD